MARGLFYNPIGGKKTTRRKSTHKSPRKSPSRRRTSVKVCKLSGRRVSVTSKARRKSVSGPRRVSVKRTSPRRVVITARNPYRRKVGVPSRAYRTKNSAGARRRVYRRPFSAMGSSLAGGPSRRSSYSGSSRGRRTRAANRRGSNPVAKKKSRRSKRSRKASALAKRRPRYKSGAKKGQFKPGKVKTTKRKRRKAKRRRKAAPKRLVVKRRGKRSVSVRAKNPRKRRRSKRRIRTRRTGRRSMVVSLRNNPVKRRRRRRSRRKNAITPRRRRRTYRRRNPMRRRTRRTYRRRNPLSIAGIKATTMDLVSTNSLKDYGAMASGFLVGAILPRTVRTQVFDRLGLSDKLPPAATEILTGAVTATLAGIVTQMVTKDKRRAVQVAGGALVGAVGALLLDVVSKYLPGGMQGFGAADMSAERAVRNAIQAEMSKSMSGGVGDFLTQSMVEDDLSMQGMGDFVTSSMVDDAATVSGLPFGAEADMDIGESIDFDYET